MDNRKNLNSIANAIYAADKILNLLNGKQGMHENYAGGKRTYDNMAVLGEIIKVIANYLPYNESHRGNHLRKIVDKYTFYEDTYKKLKQHLILVKNEGLTGDRIIETLAAIKPHIKGQQRTVIDKSIKIYKILNT
jgi:hypothetical protein